MGFTHKYASGYRVGQLHERDGTIKSVLTVTASIELDPASPSYDERKCGELQRAAVEYSKARGKTLCFDVIQFEQGHINA